MGMRLGGCSALGLAVAGYAVVQSSAVATAEEAPFNWTGFYVGAHLGGLAALTDIEDPIAPSIYGNPNRAGGGLAGGQVGYNYQSGVLVYGVEAGLSFPNIEGTNTCSAVSGWFVNATCKSDIDVVGTLAARLGVAVGSGGRTLLYGKAGAAWYDGDVGQTTNDLMEGAFGNPVSNRSTDLSRWGWTFGVGAEHALTNVWSLSAEYGYTTFGAHALALLPSAGLDGAGAVAVPVPERPGRVSHDLHAFKLGLNYRFGQASGGGDSVASPGLASASTGFGLELGTRYFYSWGRHKYDLGLIKSSPAPAASAVSRLTYDDLTASTGEVTGHLSTPWNVFAAGYIGGGSITGGNMTDEDFNIPGDTIVSIPYSNTLSPRVEGDIPTYGTIDVGYDLWRSASNRLGTYVGYNYLRETMGAYGVTQIANAFGPVGAEVGGGVTPTGHAIITQEGTWQSLRLGVSGAFEVIPRLTLRADAAFLPYVQVRAEDRHYFGNTPDIASINPLRGHGVGTQLEVALSYDLTERLSLGVGGRYWSMWTTEGTMTRTFDAPDWVGDRTLQHLKLETERIGVFGQVSYSFGD